MSTPGSSCGVTVACPRPAPGPGWKPGTRRSRSPARLSPPSDHPTGHRDPRLKDRPWPRSSFVTWDGGGNVPPALAIAHELATRGHGSVCSATAASAGAIEAAGFEAVPVREAREFAAGDPHSTREPAGDVRRPRMGRDLLVELSRRRADLVIVDTLMLGVLDVVRLGGRALRRAGALLRRDTRGAAARPARPRCCAARGLRPGRSLGEGDARGGHLAARARPSMAPSPTVHQVGPVVDLRLPYGVGVRTAVLVSLSTFGFAGMAQCACSGWSTPAPGYRPGSSSPPARSLDPAGLAVPAGVEVHRFVPHVPADGPLDSCSSATAVTAPPCRRWRTTYPCSCCPWTTRPTSLSSGAQHRAGRRRPGVLHAHGAGPTLVAAAVGELLADGPHREAAARLGAPRAGRRWSARRSADAVELALADLVITPSGE